jgi:hypothetical protein
MTFPEILAALTTTELQPSAKPLDIVVELDANIE